MTPLLKQTFSGKRVLLTGHTGFKGAWLSVMLEMLGAEVMGYALPPETSPSLFELGRVGSLCRSQIGDLRDRDRLLRLVSDHRPEFVFHLAAQSLVRRSYRDPVDTFESSFIGTMNVLEAVRGASSPLCAVLITTDKVYAEGPAGTVFRETDKLGGHDPYSTSKAACELLIDSYRKSYFQPSRFASHRKCVASARAGNVIGGGDWCEDRLLPDIVRALSVGESVRIRNPRSVRPWQHVLEPLTGYLMLAARMSVDPVRFADAYNFGPARQDSLEVEAVVQEAIRAWGGGQYHLDVDPDAPHESGYLQIDSAKAHGEIGWTPKWSANHATAETVQWYRHAMSDPLAYTRKQVNAYFGA